MKKYQSCQPLPLACSHHCALSVCPDCGTVHLEMGQISLRIRQGHFIELADLMQQASLRLGKAGLRLQ